jgi:hypothetical protein
VRTRDFPFPTTELGLLKINELSLIAMGTAMLANHHSDEAF